MGKIELTCVIIDDTNQKRKFQSDIDRILTQEGFMVNFIPVIPIEEKFLNKDKTDIVHELIENHIKEIIKNNQIDVVATDFEFLAGATYSGLNVVNLFHRESQHTPIVLYTGARTKVISSLIDSHCQLIKEKTDQGEEKEKIILSDKANLVDKIKEFMLCNVTDFVRREDYSQPVLRILRTEGKSLKKFIIDKLIEYKDDEFDCFFPPFKGKKFGEIADEINKETRYGREFLYELLEQLLAHLKKIN